MSFAALTVDFTARLAGFEEGVNKASRDVDKLGSRVGAVASGINKAFAGLGIGLGVAGFAGIIKSAIDAQDELSKLSQKTGIAVETLAGLQHAADLSGVEVDQLAKGVRTFSVLVDEAANGQKSYQDKLVSLGLNYKQLKDLSPEKQFYALADAVSKLGAQDRAAAVSGALGDRLSVLVPLLSGGAAGVRELVTEGQRLNPVTAESARKAEEFNDNLDRLKKEAGLAGIELSTSLIPSLANTSTEMANLAREGHGALALLRGFAGIGKIPWDILIGDIEPARTAQERIKELREELGSLERKSKSGNGKLLQSIFGTPEEIQQQMTVIRNQIAALEKFGDKIYTPKQSASAGGTDTAAAQRECILNGGVWDGSKCRPRPTGGGSKKPQGPIDVFDNGSFITKDKGAADFIRKQYEAVNDLQGAIAGDAQGELDKYAAKLKSLISDTPIEKTRVLQENMQLLDQAFFDGKISAELHDQAVHNLTVHMQQDFEKTRTFIDRLDDNLKSTFENAANGARNFHDVLNNVINSMGNFLAKEGGKFAGAYITDALFGSPLKVASANGNAFMGAPALSAYSGSIVSSPTVFPFANGIGLMGEAGAEAILPLKRGRDGKLGVSMGGGGGVVVYNYYTIDARGADAGVEERIRRAIADSENRAVDRSVSQVQNLNRRGALRIT